MNQVAKSQRILGDSGGYVGPLLGHFRAMLGLCWVIGGSAGGFRAAKKKPPTETFSVGGFFGVGFGLMLGRLEAMLGLCWAILGLCWAFVGSFGALLAGFRAEKTFPNRKFFGWEIFWVGFGLIVGPFGSYVGPLLGHFRAMLDSVGSFGA